MSPTTTLYTNKPYNLNGEPDLFGTHLKAETIKNMLDGNLSYFNENNLIALYGNWGSGKTSVMKYIESEAKKYEIVFFEAWKYEKDTDLALSLFEMIMDEIEKKETKIKDLVNTVKIAGRTLLTLSKHLLFNYKISALGIITLDPGKAGKDAAEELEKQFERSSYYSTVKEFNTKFNKLLEEYFKASGGKKLLVFVDDLDRCEPSHVLDLLSSIKHFFTETDKIVYFCGIDKMAVSQAIDVRYKNSLKAEEYLEKIFDVTFNMPGVQDINYLINDFLVKVEKFGSSPSNESGEILKEFLYFIQFTNPRKIKKVFNKYLLLCNLDKTQNRTLYKFIPNNFSDHNPTQMVYTIFVIILFEFYNDIFQEMYDYESKFGKLKKVFVKGEANKNGNFIKRKVGIYNDVEIDHFLDREVKTIPKLRINEQLYKRYLSDTGINDELNNNFINFILFMVPFDLEEVQFPQLKIQYNNDQLEDVKRFNKEKLMTFITEFKPSKDKILYLCIYFLVEKVFINQDYDLQSTDFSPFEIFQLANLYF